MTTNLEDVIKNAKEYFVDSTARALYYVPIIIIPEKFIAGMENEKVLKSRLLGLLLNYAGIGKLHTFCRGKIAKLTGTDENSSELRKGLVDFATGVIVGGSSYISVLYFAGADSKQGTIALPIVLGYTLGTGSIYGWFNDWFRRKLGFEGILHKSKLLNDYQKGYTDCLCKAIQMGSKKVSDDLDDILSEVPANEEQFRKAVEEIASEYDVRLHIRPYTEEVEVRSGDAYFTRHGKEIKLEPGKKHRIETFSLVLYKNEDDLKRFLELIDSERSDDDYYREMGRLYGYGEKEIEEFVRRVSGIFASYLPSERSLKQGDWVNIVSDGKTVKVRKLKTKEQ